MQNPAACWVFMDPSPVHTRAHSLRMGPKMVSAPGKPQRAAKVRARQDLSISPQAPQLGPWAGTSREDLSARMLKDLPFTESSGTPSFKTGLGENMAHVPPSPLHDSLSFQNTTN